MVEEAATALTIANPMAVVSARQDPGLALGVDRRGSLKIQGPDPSAPQGLPAACFLLGRANARSTSSSGRSVRCFPGGLRTRQFLMQRMRRWCIFGTLSRSVQAPDLVAAARTKTMDKR